MLKYFNDNIILKPITDGNTKGGIYLSSLSKNKVYEGIIQSCPPGNLKTGDHVIYEKYAGFEIKHENEVYIIIPMEDIVAKYKDGRIYSEK